MVLSAHKDWMVQCHNEASGYYGSAIAYYNKQKEYFLQQVTGAAKQAEIDLWKNNFLNRFNNEALNLQGTSLENTEAFRNGIINKIEDLAFQTLSGTKGVGYTEIINSSKGHSDTTNKNYLKNYSNRIKTIFNNYLEKDMVVKQELAQIYRQAFSTQKVSQTSLSGMISLFRKSMISQVAQNERMVMGLLSDSNIRGYINLFKGYNAEIITEAAGRKLFQELGQKWTAKQIGGSGGITDVGFSAIKEVNNIENILQTIENSAQTLPASEEGLIVSPLAAYGAQVKSWYLPQDLLSAGIDKKQFYTIGQRGDLLNSLGINSQSKQSWWHYNIVAVAKNLTKALGAANVLYVTGGNKYIWTESLIRQFREEQYYLSFYYRRSEGKFYYPPTSEMTWQQEASIGGKTGFNRGKYGSKD